MPHLRLRRRRLHCELIPPHLQSSAFAEIWDTFMPAAFVEVAYCEACVGHASCATCHPASVTPPPPCVASRIVCTEDGISINLQVGRAPANGLHDSGGSRDGVINVMRVSDCLSGHNLLSSASVDSTSLFEVLPPHRSRLCLSLSIIALASSACTSSSGALLYRGQLLVWRGLGHPPKQSELSRCRCSLNSSGDLGINWVDLAARGSAGLWDAGGHPAEA